MNKMLLVSEVAQLGKKIKRDSFFDKSLQRAPA
jgi:hypothetical protein